MNIHWIKILKTVIASFALLGLAACGGAGGGGGGIPALASQTISATMQAGTIAVNNTEVGGVMTVSTDNIGQHVLTVQNAGNKLLNAQIGQAMVFEGSKAMPLGFAGIVQSVQTANVNSIPTTTVTFATANIADVFQNLNLNMSNVTPNPQLIAGVALQNGVRTYTKTQPSTIKAIQNGLIESNLLLKQTNASVGVDFSNGIKITLWKVNGGLVDIDPKIPAEKVVLTYTGQIELENPNFSQVNIVIENGKLVTHNFQLKGTLKRNIKVAATGNAKITAAELGGWFGKGSPYYKNSTYNEISFDYNGGTAKVHGIEKDPSKILIGAVIIGVNGVIPTYGNSQTGNVLKTVPVGLVVKFFMSGDVTLDAIASVGYQWRDMDINTGVGLSYDDSLGLPVSLLTGNTKMPAPFWDAKAHLDQQEGVSFTVSGKASLTLTAGIDAGIVLTGLELAQATVEGGIRGSFSGQFDQPLGGTFGGCYSSASVTAGVRSLFDVAAGVELKTNFQSNWTNWMNTSIKGGYVYRFPMYPAKDLDYLMEKTIWSAGDDTCHVPQFSTTAGTALNNYSFDANATGYQSLVKSYSWDFGDGATTLGVTATHTYAAAGSYTPKLTVLFSDGIQKTISQPITVAAVPALNPSFTTVFNGLRASFNATTSTPIANITSYLWNFGDGTTANGIAPAHTYTAYSITPWSVTLTVTDSYGRTASTSQNVTATCPTGQVLQNGQCAITPVATSSSSSSGAIGVFTNNNGATYALTPGGAGAGGTAKLLSLPTVTVAQVIATPIAISLKDAYGNPATTSGVSIDPANDVGMVFNYYIGKISLIKLSTATEISTFDTLTTNTMSYSGASGVKIAGAVMNPVNKTIILATADGFEVVDYSNPAAPVKVREIPSLAVNATSGVGIMENFAFDAALPQGAMILTGGGASAMLLVDANTGAVYRPDTTTAARFVISDYIDAAAVDTTYHVAILADEGIGTTFVDLNQLTLNASAGTYSLPAAAVSRITTYFKKDNLAIESTNHLVMMGAGYGGRDLVVAQLKAPSVGLGFAKEVVVTMPGGVDDLGATINWFGSNDPHGVGAYITSATDPSSPNTSMAMWFSGNTTHIATIDLLGVLNGTLVGGYNPTTTNPKDITYLKIP